MREKNKSRPTCPVHKNFDRFRGRLFEKSGKMDKKNDEKCKCRVKLIKVYIFLKYFL